MSDLERFINEAKESLWFSGAKIDDHLSTFLRDHAAGCEALGRQLRPRPEQIYLVGSGGSYASMLSAKYILDRVLDIAIEAIPAYELVWRRPARLGPSSLAIVVSYSGETEDAVAALREANGAGATTVAIVGNQTSTMAREAHHAVTYESGAIFEIPIIASLLIARGLEDGTSREGGIRELVDALEGLPSVLQRTLDVEAQRAEDKARDLLPATHLYVIGSGPLAPLAYKVAMSVVMENIRIGATYSDACEWRHGPAEALERTRPEIVALLGTDESRDVSNRTIDFCRSHGARVLVYDAAEFGDVHPLLTPLVMNSHTQWLIAYSAILRGITDLDARVFMGRSLLAIGGAAWP